MGTAPRAALCSVWMDQGSQRHLPPGATQGEQTGGGGQAHGEGLLSSLEPLLGVVKMLQEKPKSRIHVGSLTHISNKHRSGFDKQQND